MTLPITPENLRGCYDFLNECDPFRRWNLPDGDEVRFIVTRSKVNAGRHWVDASGRHNIEISKNLTGHTSNLVALMAHEMIHAHERQNRASSGCGEHGAAFKRYAAVVCRVHGFDPKYF